MFLAVVIAWSPAMGQTGPAPGPSGPHSSPHAEPIEVSSRSVKVWSDGNAQWVLLAGDVALLQGDRELRAREVVVRIAEVELPEERIRVFQAEVYAEGDVRRRGTPSQASAPRARATFLTSKQIKLVPYAPTGMEKLAGPPAKAPILGRSGFFSTPARALSTVAGEPAAASDRPPATEPTPRIEPDVVPTQLTRPRGPEARAAESGTGGGASAADADAGDRGERVAQSGTRSEPRTQSGADLPPIEGAPEVPNLNNAEDLPPALDPLPEEDRSMPVPDEAPGPEGDEPETDLPPLPDEPRRPRDPQAPVIPGTQRVTVIRMREQSSVLALDPTPDKVQPILIRGGINIVATSPQHGIVDLEADSAVIWRHLDDKNTKRNIDTGGRITEDAGQPMEVYLEGHVVVRRDAQKYAGQGDQQIIQASRVYYDFLTDRSVNLDAEIDLFAPGFIVPFKLKAKQIDQFRPLIPLADGRFAFGQPEIRAEQSIMTGSRFPNPSYLIANKSIDMRRKVTGFLDPKTGKEVDDPNNPIGEPDMTWNFDARRNVFWNGWLPFFYWPRIAGDIEDLQPPLRQIAFQTNNYFGQQALLDFNGFRVIGIDRPKWIDLWNIDVDYLSYRTKDFPAFGTEIGWYGSDLIRDLTDPYHRYRRAPQHFTKDYFGYFDIWGLKDSGIDNLGSGPAIVTNGPAGAGKAGYQRSAVPPFQEMRGRFNIRHMQRFIPYDDEDHPFEDFRLQLESSYVSDRHFIEEYYKRLNDTGLDQANLAYLLYQKDNVAMSVMAEANLENFYTDTQWLPKVDYYRLGDSFLNHWFNYSQHTGADYANTHTDIMVNNPNLFAFMPYDPISNTSSVFSSGRFYTNHELDMPLNLGNIIRITPYLQGQAVGWTNQLASPTSHAVDGSLGRVWGAAGAHAEITAWKIYPWVDSELWNVHGLNNKVSFYADGRAAFSNVNLNQIAVQDDLDDNTYEFTRRYFAITNYTGGILPGPYDPRHLILRRALSPITGSTDVQGTINTVKLGVHQRLQTKRGPEGRRRIVDYMTLDAYTTFFPTPSRDNFGKPFGQSMYNWQWFIGDRTSIVSSGWFEFFNLVGSKPLTNYTVRGNDPFGLNTITSGFSISRPPRGNLYLGYTVIDTGTLKTSAMSASVSYWMSPKWYGTYSTSYDFGNGILLASTFSFTRIGADYITSIGLTVDPQRQNYSGFAVQIVPRLNPNMRLSNSAGSSTFDARYAPTQ
jgi:hypothetical protein